MSCYSLRGQSRSPSAGSSSIDRVFCLHGHIGQGRPRGKSVQMPTTSVVRWGKREHCEVTGNKDNSP